MNNISLVLQAESHPQIGYALQVPGPRFSYLTFRHKTNSTCDSAECIHRSQDTKITRGCSHAILLVEDHGVQID